MYRFLMLLTLCPSILYGQLNESFSDGEILNNPVWNGEVNNFIVNSNFALQLNDSDAGSSFINTSCDCIENAVWNFTVALDFNPSSYNYARVYLAMNNSDVELCDNAIYLDVGRSSDALDLVLLTDGETQSILSSEEGIFDVSSSSLTIQVKVTEGQWELEYDLGEGFVLAGEQTAQTLFSSVAFGVDCHYTKTMADKFQFDDITVSGEAFSGEVVGYDVNRFDIVVNEFMPDPNPVVGWPDCEYIELYNRSDNDLSLKGWTIQVNGKESVLPDVLLLSHDYLLLVPLSHIDEWDSEALGLEKWPTITNTKSDVVLLNAQGEVIDALHYKLDMCTTGSFKDEGGWSIERVDVENMSGNSSNWMWSNDLSGGTPGYENSVMDNHPDQLVPQLVYLEMLSDQLVRMHFNEVMDLLEGDLNVSTQPNIDFNTIHVDSVFLTYCDFEVQSPLGPNVGYEVDISDLNDWAGNSFESSFPVRFGQSDTLIRNDIVINEVLFNPNNDGTDFVEIYNRSAKVLDLSELYFARWDEKRVINELFPITDKHRLLFPKDYFVLSKDSLLIEVQYQCLNPNYFLNVHDMPSMPDDEGYVVLTNRVGQLIDYFEYNDEMHFDLIKDREGVSLERLSFEGPSTDMQNWGSAAYSVGYATPSYLNSNAIEDKEVSKSVALDTEVFTPDGDGVDDQLILRYTNTEDDGTLNIRIYDSQGREVKNLANNTTMGMDGFCAWDGLNENGQLQMPGIYVIWVQRFFSSGNVQVDKLISVINPGTY